MDWVASVFAFGKANFFQKVERYGLVERWFSSLSFRNS
jgi:hypothetical protein